MGNIGTLIAFRVGVRDAKSLAREFFPEFTLEDLVDLVRGHVYMRLMIDGAISRAFSLAPRASASTAASAVTILIVLIAAFYSLERHCADGATCKTVKVRAPWAPGTITPSMSPVTDGPAMNTPYGSAATSSRS